MHGGNDAEAAAHLLGEVKEKYFDGLPGLIEVFDFDYEQILDFHWRVLRNNTLISPHILCCLPCFCCCWHENLKNKIYARHICLTQDGIRYVVEKHKAACRFSFQDIGKTTKTVPYDKVTDCDIEEPAGADGPICCLVDRVLPVVLIDTASSRGGHELAVEGLMDTHAFKEAVWQCKRGEHPKLDTVRPPAQQIMGGQIVGRGTSNELVELISLAQKNNDLLQTTNELLQQVVTNTTK